MAEHISQTRKNAYFMLGVWLLWTIVGILSYARHYVEFSRLGFPGKGWRDFLDWLSCFYPWALLTPALCRLGERFPLTRDLWKRNLGGLVLGSVIMSCLALELLNLLHFGIDFALGQPRALATALWPLPMGEFGFAEFVFWSAFGTYWAVRTFQQQSRQATRLALEKAQLETSLRQAELEALRMRLNPHFLFNTLQNISVLAKQNSKLASSMLTRLGDLLRVALRRDIPSETTVQDEIALTQDYLAVEKMRFGDRLTIQSEVAPETEQALMPSFLLQPLVENAVIHGLRGVSQAGRIALRTTREGDRLVVTVADNGVGWPDHTVDEDHVGFGLTSTRERLCKMYAEEHEFAIRRTSGGGTEVRITIPFRLADKSEESVPREQRSIVNC